MSHRQKTLCIFSFFFFFKILLQNSSSSSSFPTTQTQTQAKEQEQEQEQEQRTKGYSPAIPPGEFLSAYLFFVSGFDRRAFRRAFRSSFFFLNFFNFSRNFWVRRTRDILVRFPFSSSPTETNSERAVHLL